MGAPELLHLLRGVGLVLTLTPAGGLHVAPRTALTDDHRAAIRAERDALVLALKAEAMPSAPAAPIPPDLSAMFNDCMRAGLYNDADRAALPTMFAADAEGTRVLVDAMHSRIGRCRHCLHFRRPGLSDPGYCTGRDDLRHVYGYLYELADYGGARCDLFVEG